MKHFVICLLGTAACAACALVAAAIEFLTHGGGGFGHAGGGRNHYSKNHKQ